MPHCVTGFIQNIDVDPVLLDLPNYQINRISNLITTPVSSW